jgi:hypothetical protein
MFHEWAADFVDFRSPDPLTIEFTTTPDKAPRPHDTIAHEGKAFLVDDVRFEGGDDGPTRCRVRAREAEAALKADTVDASTIALGAFKGVGHGTTGHEPPKPGGVFPRFTSGPVKKARITTSEAQRMNKTELKRWIWENDASDHERHELDRLTKADLVEIATRASGDSFIAVDPGSSKGDSTCFVKGERLEDGTVIISKMVTVDGKASAVRSYELEGRKMREAKPGADLVAEIAEALELPREDVRRLMGAKTEAIGKITCSF